MYLHCTTEEATRRQRQFARLLLENMHTQPYAEITIRHLFKAAGISRTAFYRYFECKDDVLDLLIDDALLSYYSGQLIQINDQNPIVKELYTFCNTGSARSSFWMPCKRTDWKANCWSAAGIITSGIISMHLTTGY